MKKISILVPTYNEEDNVEKLEYVIRNMMAEQLAAYDYELVFIDNDSKDKTQQKIEALCKQNKKVKAIFNAKNYDTIAKFDCIKKPSQISAYKSEYSKQVIKYAKAEKNSNHMYYFISFESQIMKDNLYAMLCLLGLGIGYILVTTLSAIVIIGLIVCGANLAIALLSL